MVRTAAERGRVVHFPWLPGLSYGQAIGWGKRRLPTGFSPALRNWIVAPAIEAGVVRPVEADHAMVETPVLLSQGGAAVTLLNWSSEPLEQMNLRIRVPFKVRAIESVRRGRLTFGETGAGVTVSLPLDAADILLLRR
jgi:hypothetical protein